MSRRALLIAACMVAAPVIARADPPLTNLGPAEPYNFFLFDNLYEMNTDAQGRVAAGGTSNLTNFSAASSYSNTDHALVGGGPLTYTNGTVYGDLRGPGPATLSGVTINGSGVSAGKPILPNDVNFASAATSLTALSAGLAQQQGIAASVAYGVITLACTSPTLDVFTLSGATLASANTLNITNANANATIVVNIDGTSDSVQNLDFQVNGVGGDQSEAHQILYNFWQAQSLTLNAASPLGSVLAPLATVYGSNAHIAGTLVAASLGTSSQVSSFEGHNYTFNGTLPVVPEPASFVLMAVGLASAAVLFRGRK